MARIARLATARLWFRPLTLSDVDALHRLWTEPGIRKYLWDDQVIPRQQAAEIVARSVELFAEAGIGLWGMFQQGAEALIGFCGYWYFRDPPELELLYGVAPAHWGKGFATEAARAMLRYGFEELGFRRVVGSTEVVNIASVRVMEKAGMVVARRAAVNGCDTVFFVLSRELFVPDNAPYQLWRAEGEGGRYGCSSHSQC
ncbi:MAG: GNAT family N-acetyltransferase [Candidatus Binatia bacterium]|nr:GNAT family N-acetyltransferase [Candidatus Binatia bacterium]